MMATSIGLLTDKYMLGATNFVDHYATDFHATPQQESFVKAAMYAGAIVGMIVMGPLSDTIGRRRGLLLCSLITLAGALLSTFAWSEDILILARIITGIGMGGEYPLASSHSAESSKSGDGAKNVALLYLLGSGGGQALCPLVTFILDIAGVPDDLLWRLIFAVGAALSLLGLILRYTTTQDSIKFTDMKAKQKDASTFAILAPYWRPLIGTAVCWLLFDIVEYGLKQNDASIFSAGEDAPYSQSVLTVFLTRVLVIPSLVLATWLLTKLSSKRVQVIGFLGCVVVNFILAVAYDDLKPITILFDALYIVQLSFQSLPGVTTMAISADIYPSAVRGTGAGISAAMGKVGATIGSYAFSELASQGMISAIFWCVTVTSLIATILTIWAIPLYDGEALDIADELARQGDSRAAVKSLFDGPPATTEKQITANDDDKETISTISSDEAQV